MARIESSPRAAPDVRRTALLAAGDALVFLLFAAMGRGSHGETVNLLQVAQVAAPFALGWAAVAPWLGAYHEDVASQPRPMLSRTMLTWVAALPVGLLLRGLLTQKVPPLSFAITTFLVLAVLLLGWRGVWAWLASRKRG